MTAEQPSEGSLDPQDEARVEELLGELLTLIDQLEDLESIRQEKKVRIKALSQVEKMLKDIQPKVSPQ